MIIVLKHVKRFNKKVWVELGTGSVELVLGLVEVAHTALSEVTRVVLVEVDPVMVLTTSVTVATGVLAVFTCANSELFLHLVHPND